MIPELASFAPRVRMFAPGCDGVISIEVGDEKDALTR